MNIKTIAATLLLTSAFLALPQDSLAGKGEPGEGRDPSAKKCPYSDEAYSRCDTELRSAYDLLAYFAKNNGNKIYFLSGNWEKDIGTLQCKISGADIKLEQRNKDDQASSLLSASLDKIWSLYEKGKLTFGAYMTLKTSFEAARYCIDYP